MVVRRTVYERHPFLRESLLLETYFERAIRLSAGAIPDPRLWSQLVMVLVLAGVLASEQNAI